MNIASEAIDEVAERLSPSEGWVREPGKPIFWLLGQGAMPTGKGAP